jgi:putative DNA primase/helicase
MRVSGRIVGLQFIDEQGGKKFLNGQTTKGATFTIDAKGLPIFCEGYATGLSIRAVMKAIKIRYSIYICFSASNLECVARGIDGGIVIADNDPNLVGEKSAQATLKPYWISPTVGEDFNDFHNRVGLFQASQSLKKIVISHASTSKT